MPRSSPIAVGVALAAAAALIALGWRLLDDRPRAEAAAAATPEDGSVAAGARPSSGARERGTAAIATAARPLAPPVRLAARPPQPPPRAPLLSVREIYELNPRLIPGLFAQSEAQLDDPQEGAREQKAWARCGWEHGQRSGLGHQGVVRVTLGYTLQVSNERAVVLDLERLEGGDDELARCLTDARPWMKQGFPVPGAKDGIFRWTGPAVAVSLEQEGRP
jgi:hypothetical protein